MHPVAHRGKGPSIRGRFAQITPGRAYVQQGLPLLTPDRYDHIDAADLRNRFRRAGVQIGTIDVVIARLCIRHDLMLLTNDKNVFLAARHCALRVWRAVR